VARVIIVSCLTCDMYKSSLRHIHDPVLSSLKMNGILSFELALEDKGPRAVPKRLLGTFRFRPEGTRT
jgi:hypothetical protein